MKMTIQIDCTAEEARQFFGLPDVKPMQQAVMAKMEQKMSDAADSLSPENILKTWFTLMPQATDQMRDAFSAWMKNPFGAGRVSRDEKGT